MEIRLIALNVNNDSQAREAAVGDPCEISFNFDENRAWDLKWLMQMARTTIPGKGITSWG